LIYKKNFNPVLRYERYLKNMGLRDSTIESFAIRVKMKDAGAMLLEDNVFSSMIIILYCGRAF